MKYIGLTCLLLFVIVSYSKADIVETIRFDTPVSFLKSNGFDIIRINGADLTSTPGNPQLPIITKHFLIPQGATVTGVEIINQLEESIEGQFDIYPVQKPSILKTPVFDFEPAPWVDKNPQIYNSKNPFPLE
ncbi:hypothetical protein KAU34_03975, partial [candidate division WOR-3 bacterium]|nr:hypothetical protein [candidate division WOR-3 bacterium]